MFKLSIVTAVAFVLGMAGAASAVTVDGTANLLLAGKSTPPEVGALVNGGDILNFTASGLVGVSAVPNLGPDGSSVFIMTSAGSAKDGISDIRAPQGALVGVFLDDSVPEAPAPVGLNFGAGDLNFASLSPVLSQIFFIGDGFNASGAAQDFIAPDGATRLFLGVMDVGDWSNNSGSFNVTVTGATGGDMVVAPVPLPAAALLLLSGLGGLALVRRRA